MRKKITLFTDGACLGNPGPGGYGAVLKYKDTERELSGGEADTTNNRMELMAIIKGLEHLKEPCFVDIYSDSKYAVDGISKGWAKKWKANGWSRGRNQPALNPDLWDRLLALTEAHSCSFHWIKGHAGHPENERCDRLAVAAAEEYK